MRIRSIAVAALALAAGVGCHKNTAAVNDAKPAGDASATGNGEEARNGLPDVKGQVSLATVYFDLDKSVIRDDAKETLNHDAEILRQNADVTVKVEGHCDERGSTQYNLALGERRAHAVRDYLTSLGVAGARLATVSYGNERPVDPGHDESAWSKNRRGELLVTNGGDKVGSSYTAGTTR